MWETGIQFPLCLYPKVSSAISVMNWISFSSRMGKRRGRDGKGIKKRRLYKLKRG